MSAVPLLQVRDLVTEFPAKGGAVRAVDGISFDLDAGETMALVGESGSGKSVTALSILQLLPARVARIVAGSVRFDGTELVGQPERVLRRLRGKDIAMVFQDPTAFLNPTLSIGAQIVEGIRTHDRSVSRQAAQRRAVELLELVGVPRPGACLRQYPHEYSGGMLQRVMIAMAISNGPRLLIADEPTTALDVTIQAQVVEVLKVVQRETGSAVILITHDLGLAAEMAERIVVMYGGRIVEAAPLPVVFDAPRHPYSVGLLGSLPQLDVRLRRLAAIPGQPSTRVGEEPGCVFRARCELAQGRARCAQERPALDEVAPGHVAACHFVDEVGPWARQRVAAVATGDGA